jgi:hypothetical protein
MQIMSITERVEFPARAVWDVVSDFGGLMRWNAAVVSCTLDGSGVGAVRTFQAGPATVRERINQFEPDTMTIGYSIVSGSSIKVKDGSLRISVKPIDAKTCELTWSMDGEPDGVPAEELAQSVSKRYVGRIEDLRNALRGGNPK